MLDIRGCAQPYMREYHKWFENQCEAVVRNELEQGIGTNMCFSLMFRIVMVFRVHLQLFHHSFLGFPTVRRRIRLDGYNRNQHVRKVIEWKRFDVKFSPVIFFRVQVVRIHPNLALSRTVRLRKKNGAS